MKKTLRSTAGLLATAVALAALGLPALADEEESSSEVAGLEVELRPAIVKAGGPVVVAAEYELDDDGADDPDDQQDEDREDDPTDELDGDPAEAGEDVEEDVTDDVAATTVGATPETATTVPAPQDAPVSFTVDFGDGSAAETMTVLGAQREADKAKARAMHRYAQDGNYVVTVTAVPQAGEAIVTTVTVNVGRGSARLSGKSRFETATRLAREDFPTDGSAGAVLLARSDAFADALAAASLAVLEDAPVLLTDSAQVPAGVLEEISRALGGTGTVYLLGGKAAIAPSVEDALVAAGHDVRRIAGDDRIDTAVRIAEFLIASGVEIDEVVLAGAGGFADALAGAAFAADQDAPVLLTGADALDPRVQALLDQLGDVEVVVAGGQRAVSEAVVAQVAGLGLEVQRLSGGDRFATSAAVAEALFDNATAVVIATGANFPDALAGAAHAGRLGAPVLLVGDVLPAAVAEYLEARAGQVQAVYVLGGSNAVSPEVMSQIEALLGLGG